MVVCKPQVSITSLCSLAAIDCHTGQSKGGYHERARVQSYSFSLSCVVLRFIGVSQQSRSCQPATCKSAQISSHFFQNALSRQFFEGEQTLRIISPQHSLISLNLNETQKGYGPKRRKQEIIMVSAVTFMNQVLLGHTGYTKAAKQGHPVEKCGNLISSLFMVTKT